MLPPASAAAVALGAITATWYAVVVAIGGRLQRGDGYGHITHAVSELTAPGARGKALLDRLFLAYGGLHAGAAAAILAIALGAAPAASVGVSAAGVAVAGFVATNAVCGALTNACFPMDARGSKATCRGQAHLGLAAALAATSLAAEASATAWAFSDGRAAAAWYCAGTLAVNTITGGAAAALAARASPVLGLAERLAIFAYLQFLAVMPALMGV